MHEHNKTMLSKKSHAGSMESITVLIDDLIQLHQFHSFDHPTSSASDTDVLWRLENTLGGMLAVEDINWCEVTRG